ncbi:MAG: GntR family transcriptional regulator [Burkholderiaceae bacterium]
MDRPQTAQHVAPVGSLARSLPSLVAERIIHAILSGALPPGARLTETALADEHKVSRSVVREALGQVERVRLIERTPRLGAQVIEISWEEVQAIADMRTVLLALAIKRAGRSETADELDAFFELVKRMTATAKQASTTPEQFGELAWEAQRRLLSLARSRWLAEMYEQLSSISIWTTAVAQRGGIHLTAQRRAESAKNWSNVATAVRKRDDKAAEAAAHAICADVARFVGQAIKRPARLADSQ